MTLCPVALAAGCRKCPIFQVCPLKSVIGDQPPAKSNADKTRQDSSKSRKR